MPATGTDLVSGLDRLPLPAVFVLTVVFVLLAIAAGTQLAKILGKHGKGGGEAIGSVIGATLGLLAFILAFTFGMTANRYDARKQLLLDEVNAIGTAYLRTGLLPPPYRSETRRLLHDYVDVRAGAARAPDTLAEALRRSEAIQDRLWALVEQMTARNLVAVPQGLFIQSLNEVIDLHGKRVIVGLQHRVPGTIWLGLYGVAALAMVVVGYEFGQARQRPLALSVLLALAFSAVILLIADLDRAAAGTVQVSQQPVLDLQQKLRSSP